MNFKHKMEHHNVKEEGETASDDKEAAKRFPVELLTFTINRG